MDGSENRKWEVLHYISDEEATALPIGMEWDTIKNIQGRSSGLWPEVTMWEDQRRAGLRR